MTEEILKNAPLDFDPRFHKIDCEIDKYFSTYDPDTAAEFARRFFDNDRLKTVLESKKSEHFI